MRCWIGILLCLLGLMILKSSVLGQDSTNAPALKPDAPVATASKTNQVKARLLIDHARADMENGRLPEAEQKLRAAFVLHPDNRAINYYLTLLRERRESRHNDAVKPIYPVIKKNDGTLEYGVPANQRYLREVADDLKAR